MGRQDNFRFLNSNFRILYGVFLLQFSFVLPLYVIIANNEQQYSAFLEGYLVFLKCSSIPALFALHYVLWRINRVSVHRWLYQKMKKSLLERASARKAAGISAQNCTPLAALAEADAGDTIPNPSAEEEQTAMDAEQRSNLDDKLGFEMHELLDAGGHSDAASDNNVTEKSGDVGMHLALVSCDGENHCKHRASHELTLANGTQEADDDSSEQKDEKDEPVTAPDIMLRIGAFGFGFAGMVLNVLRISDRWTSPMYYEYCRSQLSLWMYLLHIIFYIVQTYFIFKHQGHRFPRSSRVVRFLLVHMIVTNIALWINAVVVEVAEDLHEKTYEDLGADRSNRNESFEEILSRLTDHVPISDLIAEENSRTQFLLYFCHSQEVISASAAVYLFPLLVEYFIISASILSKIYLSSYTMSERQHIRKRSFSSKTKTKSNAKALVSLANNRRCSAHSHGGDQRCASCGTSYLGLAAGATVLLIALASVVIFLTILAQEEHDADVAETQVPKQAKGGRADHGDKDNDYDNVNESLVVNVTTGGHGSSGEDSAGRLLLIYRCAEVGLLVPPLIVTVLLSIKFHEYFLVRRPLRSERIDTQQLYLSFAGVLTYYTFIVIGSFEHLSTKGHTLQVITWMSRIGLSLLQSALQIGCITRGFRSVLPPDDATLQRRRPGRSLVAFLMLANLSLWLTSTFHLKYVDQLPESSTSNVTPWSIVVNLLTPFTIFFRFHSAITLLHIWHTDFDSHALGLV